jgi:hypothetical protein
MLAVQGGAGGGAYILKRGLYLVYMTWLAQLVMQLVLFSVCFAFSLPNTLSSDIVVTADSVREDSRV